MPLYESVFIVRQDVTAAQVDSLADSFAKIVEENGGQIARREYWGLRTLTYRIKKNRKGHYFLFNMDAPPACMQEMERNMRINEDVLRYLTVRVDEARAEPSPIMQGKGDQERQRADRSGRHGGPRGRDRDDRRDDKPARGGRERAAGESGNVDAAKADEKAANEKSAAETADAPKTSETPKTPETTES